eukprot:7573716-Alexandrium_andersonii.AAC.1
MRQATGLQERRKLAGAARPPGCNEGSASKRRATKTPRGRSARWRRPTGQRGAPTKRRFRI